MPRGKKVVIGKEPFPSIKSATEHFTKLKNDLGVCTIDKDNENFEIFQQLLNNHYYSSYFIGCGVESFFIEKNGRQNKNLLHIGVVRTDKSRQVFSLPKCINPKPVPLKEMLTEAMRESISPQTGKFFSLNCGKPCAFCGLHFGKKEVDHYDMDFCTLVDNFFECYNGNIPKNFTDYKENSRFRYDFVDYNQDMVKEWQKFHKNNTNLRMLCCSCNKTRNKQKFTTDFETI